MDQLLGLFYSLTADPAGMQAVTIGGVALATIILLWLIGKGIAGASTRARKRHDVALHAADTLSQLYGDVASGGKSAPQQASACEALTLQLCSGRTLSKVDMAALQAIRQAVLGGSGDLAKVNEQALHLSRVLSGAAPNPLPTLKLAQKQLHDAMGTKPAEPVKKPAAAPAPAKKPDTSAAPVAAKSPEAAPAILAALVDKVAEKV